MEANPDGGNYIAIVIGMYMMIEVYLIFVWGWTWAVRQMENWFRLQLFQLILIFILAILPGFYLAIILFFK